jgi:cytochrome c oxidase assembly factor CtaG
VKRHALIASVLGVTGSGVAAAHVAGPTGSADSAAGLLAVTLPILLSAALYLRGFLRQRPSPRAWAFFAGLAVLAASLLPPLDRWSASSFAFHMTQHELLMLIAAPLMVLGRPLPYFLWGLPDSWRLGVARAVRHRAVQGIWSVLLNPLVAWALHAVVLWVWHAPSFFDAALRDRGLHDLQHLSFLLSALIFWSALLEERARERQGAAVLYLFTTTVHTGVLGALLTFAGHPWYEAYFETTPQWNLAPLEDQQIGGLIMWVPASLVYVGVGLALLARWIESSDATGLRHPES